jgi:hypothetical protein
MKIIYVIAISLVFFSCKQQTNSMGETSAEEVSQQTIDSMKVVMEKQRIIDSMKIEMERQKPEKEIIVTHSTTTTSPTQTTTTERKGWSSTAKGAVIGAGVGAATGAIISKKKGEGAIIGGLAGAGIGAGTGAIIDGSKK